MRKKSPDERDWREAADLVATASGATSLDDLVAAILRGMHALFAAELVIWDRFDGDARQLAYRMHPDATATIAALQPAFVRHWHQHPFCHDWVTTIGGGRIGILSDRISTRDFVRTDLWREVYCHLHAKHQIALGGRIDATTYWSIGCNRLRLDYGRRERDLGRFLQPHFTALFQRHARRTAAERPAVLLVEALGAANTAYLTTDADGRVENVSEAARRLLAVEGTAPAVGTVISDLAAPAAGQVLHAPVSRHTLGPCPAVVIRPNRLGSALVLLTPADADNPRDQPVSLTTRETEILHWVGEGKNNREISILLGISPRTVEKHCERLFEKLGVENRLSAALLARRSG
jgi:DNA-binding CsgD family transcriptional regulator